MFGKITAMSNVIDLAERRTRAARQCEPSAVQPDAPPESGPRQLGTQDDGTVLLDSRRPKPHALAAFPVLIRADDRALGGVFAVSCDKRTSAMDAWFTSEKLRVGCTLKPSEAITLLEAAAAAYGYRLAPIDPLPPPGFRTA